MDPFFGESPFGNKNQVFPQGFKVVLSGEMIPMAQGWLLVLIFKAIPYLYVYPFRVRVCVEHCAQSHVKVSIVTPTDGNDFLYCMNT